MGIDPNSSISPSPSRERVGVRVQTEEIMKKRKKTNRLKATLRRKNVKHSLRKSKGERKYPT